MKTRQARNWVGFKASRSEQGGDRNSGIRSRGSGLASQHVPPALLAGVCHPAVTLFPQEAGQWCACLSSPQVSALDGPDFTPSDEAPQGAESLGSFAPEVCEPEHSVYLVAPLEFFK